MRARKIVKMIAVEGGPSYEGEPKLDAAGWFLWELDEGSKFTFQSVDDNRLRNDARLNCVLFGTFEQHKEELARLNAAGAGIFVMVNRGDGTVRRGEKTCLTNSNVTAVRAAFVSFDQTSLDAMCQNCRLPSFLVETSPGHWDMYWITAQCSLAEFESMQKRLAKLYKGERGARELSTVRRLPGFINHQVGSFLTHSATLA